ncbi:MAG: PSD1 and planctomycete cytochrome C domain-containing protein [Planctomycetota bacterium]|nr:PSD1 and planctomycete cytochrome C domain-containing protein [Planctomycetota bacterium]
MLSNLLLLLGTGLPPLPAPQAAGADAPGWSEEVRPILAEHCFECHGPDPETRAARLRLDTEEGLIQTARGGPDHELLYRVTSDEDFERMPPPEHSEGLSAAEVDVLTRWVEAGAPWEPHWAYAPLSAAGPKSDRTIDGFIEARLVAEGLEPAPAAAPGDLIRRLHLDLTGLPPTPDARAAFLADPSDAAYAARVDELLGSTAFGEHWARHWLDVARYADSHGFTIDGGRTVWPWRDWVVHAIATDLPFDQFTVDQLAGDLEPSATRAQRIATGFHRNTQVNQEGGAKDEENRVHAVIDRVATTGAAWLGATVGCAQCHTHKFDPITQTEFFGLYALFNNTADSGVSSGPTMLVPRGADEELAAAAWEAERDRLDGAYADAWDRAGNDWQVWQPARATGSNGPELRPEPDGSYRVVGQNPIYSTYVLEGEPGARTLGALRLEVLPDGGPGRSGNRNFVLQEVRVERLPAGADQWEPLELAAARADFEQDTSEGGGARYAVAGALPGSGAPGWAIKPEFDAPHAAEFNLRTPSRLREGDRLRVELQQEHGARHTLGRFRLLLTDEDPGPERDLAPAAWAEAWTAKRAHGRKRPGLPMTMVMEERSAPRDTRRFHRGSFLDPREPVSPGVPAALDGFREDPSFVRNRLDLAHWLMDPGNALVQRVTVNRWWQQLMGAGLVVTENDFGLRGARPTHPELLDWLAAELRDSGFSRRHVLRQVLLSSAYRQAALTDPDLLERDPNNALLARQVRRRLSGEQLRDAMLSVAGVLDPKVGGPPVQPPQPEGVYAFTQNRKSWKPSEGSARHRRSLYTRIWRSAAFPFYTTFDAPAANVTCTRRVPSRSPLQALALANDPLVVELAAAFGARISALEAASDDARIDAAFRLALGRPPADPERERLANHVRSVREARGEDAAWFALARVLFNLGEFTHRP